jgi:hypothetical protein
MSRKLKITKAKSDKSRVEIPRDDWAEFLDNFTVQHHGWVVEIKTHDLVTAETVLSRATPFERVELDLEDENNPRINLIVQLDNKVIKHILFEPSRLVFESSSDRQELLRIETVNTATVIYFRVPAISKDRSK